MYDFLANYGSVISSDVPGAGRRDRDLWGIIGRAINRVSSLAGGARYCAMSRDTGRSRRGAADVARERARSLAPVGVYGNKQRGIVFLSS